MNKYEVLTKLRSGQPLFDSFLPRPAFRIPMGVETELGVNEDDNLETGFLLFNRVLNQLEEWQQNGARVYRDGDHVETCTPETSNALDLSLYIKSIWKRAIRMNLTDKLYANNRGKEISSNAQPGVSFGCHENIATTLNLLRKRWLVPYLIARTLIAGSGFCTHDGLFELSQRAAFIDHIESDGTTSKRGIIGSRYNQSDDLNDESVPRKRMHLILADTVQSDVQLFLRSHMLALLVRMAEDKILPIIPFANNAIDDLKILSSSSAKWLTSKSVSGMQYWRMPSMNRTAFSILCQFLEAVQKYYAREDDITDLFILLFEDTLQRLETDPLSLSSRLDCFAKLRVLRAHIADNHGVVDPDFVQHFNIGFHRLGEHGAYAGFEELKMVERLFSVRLFQDKMYIPPKDTRAYFRGNIIRLCNQSNGTLELSDCSWKMCAVTSRLRSNPSLQKFQIPDASIAYKGKLKRFKALYL